MSATYRLFPHPHVWRTGLLRVEWEITDGIGGPVLDSGHRRTRARANLDVAIVAPLMKPHPALVLEQRLAPVIARLDRHGLRVTVTVDERLRVCVRPLCPCSTRDRMRIARDFLAITEHVVLACRIHETPLESCGMCRRTGGAARGEVA